MSNFSRVRNWFITSIIILFKKVHVWELWKIFQHFLWLRYFWENSFFQEPRCIFKGLIPKIFFFDDSTLTLVINGFIFWNFWRIDCYFKPNNLPWSSKQWLNKMKKKKKIANSYRTTTVYRRLATKNNKFKWAWQEVSIKWVI